jgi:hypothetical protein
LLGGFDSTAAAAIATVATVAYLGGGAISGPMPQPSLPDAAFSAVAGATSGTVVFAGGAGNNPGGGSSFLASAWTASWDPSTGTVGSWTAQAGINRLSTCANSPRLVASAAARTINGHGRRLDRLVPGRRPATARDQGGRT